MSNCWLHFQLQFFSLTCRALLSFIVAFHQDDGLGFVKYSANRIIILIFGSSFFFFYFSVSVPSYEYILQNKTPDRFFMYQLVVVTSHDMEKK